MLDFTNQYLIQIERFLQVAKAETDAIDDDDLDPREIIYQTIDQVKQHSYRYGNILCVPNIITISFPETKREKAEDLETIFNDQRFIMLFQHFLAGENLRVFNPLRVEIQTVSKGNSRVMYRRAALALDWPGNDMAAEDVRVTVDLMKREVTSVVPPRPEIPQLARLNALNAEVYQNQYLITKLNVYIGRLRTVINEDNGKMIRRNDFVFYHRNQPNNIGNSVSRQHATITYRNNSFFLIDHGSANGTAIQRGEANGEYMVTQHHIQGVKLEHGDMIRFGHAWVSFELIPTENS